MRFFDLLIGSFHSAETYRLVRQSGGFFMGYALLVVMLCTLAVTIHYGRLIDSELFTVRDGTSAKFDDMVDQIARQVPVMTVTGQKLVSSEDAPRIITVSGEMFGVEFTDKPIITIDTTGTTTYDTMTTPVLLNAREFVIKKTDKVEIKPISDVLQEVPEGKILDRAAVNDIASELKAKFYENQAKIYVILGFIAWIVFTISMYVLRIFMLLLLGIAGLAMKRSLPYATSVGLASVSFTAVAVLDTILFAGFQYPANNITLFIAGCVTLYAAIRCSEGPPRSTLIT